MTENWIDSYHKAPTEVQHACKRVMEGRTTIKFETERLGEKNFEWPAPFKDIMWQYNLQKGSISAIEGE